MTSRSDLEDWSARGWAVFPCHNVEPDGRCSCGDPSCKSVGKHPRTFNGVKGATSTLTQLLAWAKDWPTANWALATGSPSGVWVLDLDVKAGTDGSQEFEQWLASSHARMPETRVVTSGGGGRHYYWTMPDSEKVPNKVNLLPGVDVRGDGGYVLLPGSNHVSGGTYAVRPDRDVEPKGADPRLVSFVRSASGASGSMIADLSTDDLMDGIPEGSRDDMLFRLACRLRRQLGDNRTAVTMLVLAAAQNSSPPFPEAEALRKVAQAFAQDHSEPGFGVFFDGASSDLYVDVAEAIAGGLEPVQPDAGSQRTDGLFLAYSGSVNVLMGDPESGKTLIALAMIVDTLNRGGSAAVIDLDHNGTVETVSRLLSFGADPAVLSDRERFRLAIPESRDEYMGLVADLTAWAPGIVLVDSIGELGALFGANLNRDEDYAPLNRRAIQPFATAGSAVIAVDHLAKNEASRRFGAAGTVRKKAAVGGAMYEVKAGPEGFSRSRGGRARLILKKDRPGGIRDRCPAEREPVVADFVLAPGALGLAASWAFEPGIPAIDAVARRVELRSGQGRDAVLGYLAENGTAITRELEEVLEAAGVRNKGERVRLLGTLESEGVVSVERRGTARVYSLIEPAA